MAWKQFGNPSPPSISRDSPFQQRNVQPIDSADEYLGILGVEPSYDPRLHFVLRHRGERQEGRVAELAPDLAEASVL